MEKIAIYEAVIKLRGMKSDVDEAIKTGKHGVFLSVEVEHSCPVKIGSVDAGQGVRSPEHFKQACKDL